MEDTEIIEMYWERNEQAIRETELKYGKLCKQLAKNILFNLEDAEEVVNETYLGMWNTIPPNRPEYLKAFICKITRNLALTKVRYYNAEKRKTEQVLSLEEVEDIVSGKNNIEEKNEGEEITTLMNEYLGRIGKIKRIMFVKRYWFSESISDIAKELGVSESKVKTTLFRVRRELRKYLEGKGIVL